MTNRKTSGARVRAGLAVTATMLHAVALMLFDVRVAPPPTLESLIDIDVVDNATLQQVAMQSRSAGDPPATSSLSDGSMGPATPVDMTQPPAIMPPFKPPAERTDSPASDLPKTTEAEDDRPVAPPADLPKSAEAEDDRPVAPPVQTMPAAIDNAAETVAALPARTVAEPPKKTVPSTDTKTKTQKRLPPRQIEKEEGSAAARTAQRSRSAVAAPPGAIKNAGAAGPSQRAEFGDGGRSGSAGKRNAQVGEGISGAAYAAQVLAQIQARKFYPAGAKAAGMVGVVGFSFVIGASGAPSRFSLTRSSGSAALDQAARQIVMSIRAAPPPGGSFAASSSLSFSFSR